MGGSSDHTTGYRGGAAQSIMQADVTDLPESAALETFALVKDIGRDYGAVPLYQVFLWTNVFSGYATVGVVPTLPFPDVGLLVAGGWVMITPMVAPVPHKGEKMKELMREHPKAFAVCVVTRS